MTARTSQLLADALKAGGFVELAARAEKDEFHDFLSPHAMPEMVLAETLALLSRDFTLTERHRMAAYNIRQRLIDGEFDADLKESDEWAESPEGQAAFKMLKEGK